LLAVWQGGSLGRGAPNFGRTRLRDRLAAAMRWSPLGAPSGSRNTQRMGRRAAVATPNEDSIFSGDESTPLEKGEPRAGSECGPATSSESDAGNE